MRSSSQWVHVGVMIGLLSVGACATPHRSPRRPVTDVATGCPTPAVGTDAAAALFCGYRPGAQAPCPAGLPPASRRTFGTLVTDVPLRDGTELRIGADLPPAIERDVDEGRRSLPPACEFPIAVVQRTWRGADSVTAATVLEVIRHVVADSGSDAPPRCLQSPGGVRTSRAWVVGTQYLTVITQRDSVRSKPAAHMVSPATLTVKIGDEDAWWRRPVPLSLEDMAPVPCAASEAVLTPPTR